MQNDPPRHSSARNNTTLLHSDGISTLCFELSAPSEVLMLANHKKAWSRPSLIELLPRRRNWFVASREQPGTFAESIAGIHVAPIPAICEPRGIWVSLYATQER
jgi:hypothetical protein